MKIFYADDDQDEIDFFCEVIKAVDPSVECITAPDGHKALQLLERIAAPDFIFLDLNMPRINGRECLAKIKNNQRLRHIPVIIYSNAASKNSDALRKEGAYKVINKSWEIKQISNELQSILVTANTTDRQVNTPL
jgi:CheY-like chemotaxis protein